MASHRHRLRRSDAVDESLLREFVPFLAEMDRIAERGERALADFRETDRKWENRK